MGADSVDLGGTWTRRVGGRQIDFVTVPGSYPPLGECDLEFEYECPAGGPPPGRYFLVTEGVLAKATFFLNGQELGTAGPWATYRFEIPKGLLGAHNAVRAHVRDIPEAFGPTPGRRFDAGLVRPLWIERRPETFLEDFAFRATLNAACTSADCTVAVELNGRAAAKVQIVLAEKASGRVVAKAEAAADRPARFTVEWPGLWSPAMPNLYTLTATLPGAEPDALTENVGFRRLSVRGPDFYLNDERLFLKGVCRHEFTDTGGYSPTEDEVRRELGLIKHAGFNYIRLVHSPQAACVSRIAAEIGLLVSEEPGTCFHDLANEAIYAPAFECLRRTVKRDRNVPSIFAWLIYNECNPNTEYAVRAAKVCREMDPDCRLGMADCSGRHDDVKAMVKAADMMFYGINVYALWPNEYCERMKLFTDRPIVFTEWGGTWGQGNARFLKDLCDMFVIHSRPGESIRLAGCSFWAWSDYEEHSRKGPATTDGWTIEGLVDAAGRPRPDLATLSMMCFEVDRPPLRLTPRIEILAPAPRRRENLPSPYPLPQGERENNEPWEPVDLAKLGADQADLEKAVDDWRKGHLRYEPGFIPQDATLPAMPRFGRLLLDGIEFRCRDAAGPAHPLLVGKGCEEVTIPVGRRVSALAALGHVAIQGGYPSSTIFSVHHRDAEVAKGFGTPAAEYRFEFEDGEVTVPLRHGMEILRSNDVCRWWTPGARAPETRPAVRVAINKTFEVLRLDLWEHTLAKPRFLKAIRWRLADPEAILLLYGLSVRVAT